MGTTAAREAARERIVREAASGNGRGRGRQHAGEQHLGWRQRSERRSERRQQRYSSDGDDGGNEEWVGYHRSLLQRWGGGEVSMCPRARIP